MARRTPGLQARSQVHGYWGQFQYDDSVPPATHLGRTGDVGSAQLPNVSVALSATEFAKLEIGDWAATTDAVTGANIGFWTCVFPGTVGVGGAVWARTDNASLAVQTIRDAHMVVVARQPGLAPSPFSGSAANDTLLNWPQVAGVAADFIDTGSGTELALGIAAANAMSLNGVRADVRLRAGIWGSPSPILAPFTLADGVRISGAGTEATTVVFQGAGFVLSNKGSLRDMTVVSLADAAATVAGVISTIGEGDFSVMQAEVVFEGAAADRGACNVGVISAPSTTAIRGSRITLSDVRVSAAASHAAQANRLVGVLVEGHTLGGSLSNISIERTDIGVYVSSNNGIVSSGYKLQDIDGRNLSYVGAAIRAANVTPMEGISLTNFNFQFDGPATVDDQFIGVEITSSGLATMTQVHVTAGTVQFGANGLANNRMFGRVVHAGSGGEGVTGIGFTNCGVSGTFPLQAPTQGIILVSNCPTPMYGGALLCDFGGRYALALADAIFVDPASTNPASASYWEYAHNKGAV